MKYLLDTDTVSFALRGLGRVGERLRQTPPADVAVSSITEAELWYGVEKRRSRKLAALVAAFLEPLCIVEFDRAAAKIYGTLMNRLEQSGVTIGMSDTMIASLGISRHLVVVTGNTRHFSRIRGLAVEDWR